ncbi:hypothetical protein PR202_gb00221 [Eleusine coracana subsp. coracana]|uniref:Uncharacterized protein n=1 Tax=Eleusine coracana subsp. coracana TaxID=191504 RepID=A0AAV5DS20_ELECO|nr:hypothetical protein PR202_gb00221 [Eleusine coracana subsp. coracana]
MYLESSRPARSPTLRTRSNPRLHTFLLPLPLQFRSPILIPFLPPSVVCRGSIRRPYRCCQGGRLLESSLASFLTTSGVSCQLPHSLRPSRSPMPTLNPFASFPRRLPDRAAICYSHRAAPPVCPIRRLQHTLRVAVQLEPRLAARLTLACWLVT